MNQPSTYGFWKNSNDTIGFAACNRCEAGEQSRSITWQNGSITLCDAHYEEHVAQKDLERIARRNSGFKGARA